MEQDCIWPQRFLIPKLHCTRFRVDGEAANLFTTCWQQVVAIWETTRRNRKNGLLPVPTCYGLVVYVADWLRTCYGETGVMDFGLYQGT